MPTISYKQNKNRGIVLVQTGQQVEHLQSCIMTSRRARNASRQLEGTGKVCDASSDKKRTFYHLQIQFIQMLRAQTKDEGKDQYDLSIGQHPWNSLSFSIVLQQRWKANFNDRRNDVLAAECSHIQKTPSAIRKVRMISQLHKKFNDMRKCLQGWRKKIQRFQSRFIWKLVFTT